MGVVVIPIQLMSQINNNDRSRCRCTCMLRSGTASRKSVSTVAVTGAKEVSFRLLAMLSWNYHCMKLNFIANSINQFPLPAKLLQIQESIPVGCQPPACRWYVLHTEQVWQKILGEGGSCRVKANLNKFEHVQGVSVQWGPSWTSLKMSWRGAGSCTAGVGSWDSVNRQTHMTEAVTFVQLPWWVVTSKHQQS